MTNPILKIRKERKKEFDKFFNQASETYDGFYFCKRCESIRNVCFHKGTKELKKNLKSFLSQTENLILEEIEKWAEEKLKPCKICLKEKNNLSTLSGIHEKTLSDLQTFFKESK